MSRIPAKSYGQTKMVQYLTRKIDALRGLKSQKQIAREIGYDLPNIVSMMKMGEARVPLEKVPALAKAIGCDVGHLMRLGLEQYWPDKLDVIHEVFGRVVTANEWEIVQVFRKETRDMDPRIDEEHIDKLRLLFRNVT